LYWLITLDLLSGRLCFELVFVLFIFGLGFCEQVGPVFWAKDEVILWQFVSA